MVGARRERGLSFAHPTTRMSVPSPREPSSQPDERPFASVAMMARGMLFGYSPPCPPYGKSSRRRLRLCPATRPLVTPLRSSGQVKRCNSTLVSQSDGHLKPNPCRMNEFPPRGRTQTAAGVLYAIGKHRRRVMEDADKLAIAILAASRCSALGKTWPADYVDSYARIEKAFESFRQDKDRRRTEERNETLKKL